MFFGSTAFSEVSFDALPPTFSSLIISGVASTSAVNFGSLTSQGSLTAATGTGGVTSPTAFTSSQQSGRIATGNVGTVTPQIAPTGTAVSATGTLGTMSFSYSATISSGVTGTANAGTLIPKNSPALSSVTAVGSLGSFPRVFFWTQVNDTQSPNWTQINTN